MPRSNGIEWTPKLIAAAKKELASAARVQDTLPALSKLAGRPVTIDALRFALRARGEEPGKLLGKPAVRGARKWTPEKIAIAKRILSQHTDVRAASAQIADATGLLASASRLDGAFATAGEKPPATFCAAKALRVIDEGERLHRLVAVIGKAPLAFAALCDKLDLAPTKAKDLIEQARAQGVRVHVEHDHVGLKFDGPSEQIEDLHVAPVVGKEQVIAHITDTHLGSKYCLRPQLREFIEYAYQQGAREVLHTGDVVDGDYTHAKFEMSHVGLEDQSADLFETLPKKKGLTYHCITGNHDHTFAAKSGVDVGEYITQYFRSRGRDDLRFYGNRGAYLQLRGAVVHLWHPKKGVAYALSYGIQKQIEKYAAIKPQVLLVGHWHVFTYVVERGIHALAGGTFQGGGSEFSKSLGGAPAIGGSILRWTNTVDGTIRGFSVERRAYFEREVPVQIYNQLDAEPIDSPKR
jgi:hypothetical protein